MAPAAYDLSCWWNVKHKIAHSGLSVIYRGSYMSGHVLLNLLTSWGKVIKCEACRAFYYFFATSLINSIIQEHEC